MVLAPVVIYNGLKKNLLLLALNLIFVAIGIWMIMDGERWSGWFVSVFFGLGALVFSWSLLDRRPRLVLDHEGISDRTLGVGKILWSDIDDATLRRVSSAWFIELSIDDNVRAAYLDQLSLTRKRLSRGNRYVGFAELNINLTGVRGRPEEIFKTFVEFLVAAKNA